MDTVQTDAITPTRRGSGLDWSRWSGLAFLVLLIVAAITGLGGPNPYTDGPGEYAEYYADEHGGTALAPIAAGLAAVFFVWMLTRVVGMADRRPLQSSPMRLAIFGTGVLFVVGISAAITTSVAVSNAVNIVDGFEPDAQTAIALDMLSDAFFQVGLVAAGGLSWAVALAGRRSGRLSGWMSWTGFVLAPLVALAWVLFMLPAVVFLVWLVAVSMIASRPDAEVES